MIQQEFGGTYPKAAMDTKKVLEELTKFKKVRGRPTGPKAALLAELRQQESLQAQFEQIIRAKYGIDFPFWRHTGPPNTNTARATEADVDLWFHQAQSVPKSLQMEINTYFDIPLKRK